MDMRHQPAAVADRDIRADHAIGPDPTSRPTTAPDPQCAQSGSIHRQPPRPWRRLRPRRPADPPLSPHRETTTSSVGARAWSCGTRSCLRAPPACEIWPCRWSGNIRVAEHGLPCRDKMQSAPAVCAIPSITSTPGNTGLPGKWPRNCGSLTVTFLMPIAQFVSAHIDDAVDHQEWIAVRQRLQDRRDVRRLEHRRRLVHGTFLIVLRIVRANRYRVRKSFECPPLRATIA